MTAHKLSRRRFVQGAAALAASLAIPIKRPDAEAQTLVESAPVEESFEWLPADEPLQFDFGPGDPVEIIGSYDVAPPDEDAPLHLFNERGDLIAVSWFATLEASWPRIDTTPYWGDARRYVSLPPEYQLVFQSNIFDPERVATILIREPGGTSVSGRFALISYNLQHGSDRWPMECMGFLHDLMVVT